MSQYQPYPAYKNSGIEWLGQVPEHWDTSYLRYLFNFGKGLTITKADLVDDGVPCVNYGEVHSKFGFEVNPEVHVLKCVPESYLTSFRSALLKKGDFVFADTSEDLEGSGNFTQLTSGVPTFAGYHTVIARSLTNANDRFLAYLMDSQEFRTQIQLAVKGVKVFSITQAILRSAFAWLPSVTEQTQIANFLDQETSKIDTLIAKQQTLIELLKEKRQAVISHAVTKGLNPNAKMKDSGIQWLGDIPEHWTVLTMKHLISTRKGIAFKAVDFCDEGVRVVKASDIKKGSINTANVFLPFSHKTSYPKAILKEGEIVISTVGSNPDVVNSAVGQIGIVPQNLDGSLLNQNTVIFSPDNKQVDNIFLSYVLFSQAYREHLDLHAHGTANQSSLNVEDMLSFGLALPSLSEQEQIVVMLDTQTQKIDTLIDKSQQAITLLKERKTALISAAVTGKIDVRGVA